MLYRFLVKTKKKGKTNVTRKQKEKSEKKYKRKN